MASGLTCFEEFRSTLRYCFFLFRRPFTASLEEGAKVQWAKMQAGDVAVKEDGQNNPLVDLRLDPDFGRALFAALADADGNLPSLPMPRTPGQVAFWRERASSSMLPEAFEELSESTSHLETVREALAWHAASAAGPPDAPLRVCILGASARYEYAGAGGGGGQELTELLAAAAARAAPGRRAEFVLCGRDVPSELHGRELASSSGATVTRHLVGYLHDLPAADLGGSLLVALHSGIGLDHPELSTSWPPTLKRLRDLAPVSLVVTSFNPVEHEAAERTIRAVMLTQLEVHYSGVNAVGSLRGKDELRPFDFDGAQGKRNYCVLQARVSPPKSQEGEGWDLFE